MARAKKDSTDPNPFASRLRELMEERGVTQGDIAAVTGRSRQTVSQYVNGISEPGYDNLVNIAVALNVSTDYLLGLSEIKSINPEITLAQKITGLDEYSIDKLWAQSKIAEGDSDADLTLEMVDEFIDFALGCYGKHSPVALYWNFRKQYDRMIESNDQTMLTTISDTGDVVMSPYAAADHFRTALCDRFKEYLQDLYPLPDDPSKEDGNGND